MLLSGRTLRFLFPDRDGCGTREAIVPCREHVYRRSRRHASADRSPASPKVVLARGPAQEDRQRSSSWSASQNYYRSMQCKECRYLLHCHGNITAIKHK
jgi:radical SAM protein with 4Fe4S-binding SPASM domain